MEVVIVSLCSDYICNTYKVLTHIITCHLICSHLTSEETEAQRVELSKFTQLVMVGSVFNLLTFDSIALSFFIIPSWNYEFGIWNIGKCL